MNATKRSFLSAVGTILALSISAPVGAQVSAQSPELAAMVQAAKAEGRVNYVEAVATADTVAKLAKGFKARYGLPDSFNVAYTQANTSAIVTRLQQEMAASRMSVDVVGLAAPSWVFSRVASGDIMKYASPEYKHYQRSFELGMGLDEYFAFNGAYFFVPAWNAAKLDFKGTSWADVMGAVPSQRLSMGNSEASLANLITFMGVRKVMGEDYYKKIAEMGPRIIQAGEMAHDRVLSGQDLMTLYGQATHVKRRNDLGGTLKMMIPKEGLVLLPQNLFIMNKAPNPNAAKLWLDYLLSEEGQKIISTEESLISGRAGAASPLPDYPLTIDTLRVIPIDWAKLSDEDLAAAKKDWQSIFR